MVTELCLALDPPVPRTVGATFSSGFGAGNGRVRSTRADSPAKPTSEVHSMRPAKSTFTEIPPCWSGISVMRLVKKKLQPPPPPPGPGSGNGSSIGSRLPIAPSASGGVLTGSSEVTSAVAGVALDRRARHIQALTGMDGPQGDRLPDLRRRAEQPALVGAAVTLPLLDRCSVVDGSAGNIQACA